MEEQDGVRHGGREGGRERERWERKRKGERWEERTRWERGREGAVFIDLLSSLLKRRMRGGEKEREGGREQSSLISSPLCCNVSVVYIPLPWLWEGSSIVIALFSVKEA